jgi:LPS-assembly protein
MSACMIAPPHLRTLLGAALCWAPVLAAAAGANGSDPSASPRSSSISDGSALASAQVPGARGDDTGFNGLVAPCLFFLAPQSTPASVTPSTPPASTQPLRVASAAPPPSKPAGKSLQRVRRPSRFRITGPITTSSKRLQTGSNGVVTLTGDVDVHMGDHEIQADQATYDRQSNAINVSGKVRYSDPNIKLQGTSGHYDDEGAQFSDAQFQFLKLPGRGSAAEMSMNANNVVTLQRVTYTSCPPPRSDWDLRARLIRLDTDAGRGVGEGAKVDFEGIPIFYLPYISFPLSTARQSGFLFPQLGSSSRDGIIFGVPWYWNIAPNQDATFTPTEYTTRGLNMGVEYRFLTSATDGTLDADYLPHDASYHAERNYLRLVDRLELGDNTRVQTDLESVSDTEYFEDFSIGTQTTSTPFLPRSVAITHRDDIWDLRLEGLGYQTIDETLPIDARPYVEMPRLSAVAAWSPPDLSVLRLGFASEAVDFSRTACMLTSCLMAASSDLADFPLGVGVSGWRLDAQPNLGLDFSGPGYFFRPTATWEFTEYLLHDTSAADPALPATAYSGTYGLYNPYGAYGSYGGGYGGYGSGYGAYAAGIRPGADPDLTLTRNLPIVTIDSGVLLERFAASAGSSVSSVTLEPRLMYTYIPYRDQDDLPLFDTAEPDPNLIELFRPNRYVGLDRIGDANAVTLGVTSELFGSSGTRYLSASLGQSLFLQPPRVSLPGETLSQHTSDLIGEINLTAYRNWNLMLDAAANQEVTRIAEAEVELQYRASGSQVVNVNYQYRHDEYEQIDTSAAWPILARWDLYARSVYSLFDRAPIEDFAGFQYRGDCWGARAVWQRSVTLRNGERDSGFMLQVELTGLSNVGSQVSTFLQQSIRGYSPATGRPGMPLSTP